MNENQANNQFPAIFALSSLYTAAFLLSKNFTLVDIDRSQPRAKFIFQDQNNREELIHSFNYSPEDAQEVLVDARKFINSIKTLKDRLYLERGPHEAD